MEPKEIIEKQSDQFINYIETFSDLNKLSGFANEECLFQIFMPKETRVFNEQKFFEELLENSIWKYLVNGVIKGLFEHYYNGDNSVLFEMETMNPQLTSSYVQNIEKRYPLEFTIKKNGKNIGYKYTGDCYKKEYYNNIFENRCVDCITVIKFEYNKNTKQHKHSIPKEFENKIYEQSLKDFFAEFFPISLYEIYISVVRESLVKALDYIGLQSVQELSLQHLPFFKEKILTELKRKKFDKYNYYFANGFNCVKNNYQTILDNNDNIFTKIDCETMNINFFDNNRLLSLVGKNDFAHSFITSEYLYNTLKFNNVFDYTSIISGYLKSIEQLLYLYMLLTLSSNYAEGLWIKHNGKRYNKRIRDEFSIIRNIKHVRFDINNKDYFDTTFSALVHFINDNQSGWCVSDGARNRITTLLLVYCDECRNEHFHKDNINDPEEVKKIRDNTLLLLYYLLGAYNISLYIDDEKQSLGFIDLHYYYLYKALMKERGGYLLLSYKGDSDILVAVPMNQEHPRFDRNGDLINKKIRTIRIKRKNIKDWKKDDWLEIEADFSSDKLLYITPDNIPNKVERFDKLTAEFKNIKIDF